MKLEDVKLCTDCGHHGAQAGRTTACRRHPLLRLSEARALCGGSLWAPRPLPKQQAPAPIPPDLVERLLRAAAAPDVCNSICDLLEEAAETIALGRMGGA